MLFMLVSVPGVSYAQSSPDRQRQYLEDILKINTPKDHRHPISRRITVQDSTWLDWLHRSGELPPDFSQMRATPFLPEPLLMEQNGKDVPIRTPAQWREKCDWIKQQYRHWISGTAPPAPAHFEARVLADRYESGVRLQMIQTVFGPGNKATITFELMIPPGPGPFPVYMTQWNHRSWAQLAVRRGYIGCVYAASDDMDDTQAYQTLYPQYDFTCLMRRAWGASRVIDYLYTRPEVNKKQIAITGHSRNGKQSLWAAAFDERITAVVSSSCGTGGVTPWRYSDPQYCNQTLDDICANAAHWFHPRLRFFFGREDRLPVDQNLLLALIAPRPLLLHYSTMEAQLHPWASEQCYRSAKKVYRFLHAPDNISILPRAGEHAVAARDLESCIDFLDIPFKRSMLPWQEQTFFNDDTDDWLRRHQSEKQTALQLGPVRLRDTYMDTAQYAAQRKTILHHLQWLLGDQPAGVKPLETGPTLASRVDWMDRITGRPEVKRAKVIHIGPYTAMGDHLPGTLYYPLNKEKAPVVIYLHQYAYAHGYARGYSADGGRGNDELFQTLIDKGFAVMAFDMYGFGTRMAEAQFFYQRFPQWSKMGKMVSDVQACVDALQSMKNIDGGRIFLLGNTIGGSVALMAAALDRRIAGVAAVAAVTPWRSSNRQYESLRTYSHQHTFMPRLGWYANDPARTPVDFGEIVSCIAPRPALVIAPTLDRYADPAAVQRAMQPVKAVYALHHATGAFILDTPREINRMTRAMYQQTADFFNSIDQTHYN
jgi:dienelactone hydrolase